MNTARIAGIQIPTDPPWEACSQALREAGFELSGPLRHATLFWDPKKVRAVPREQLTYVDGWTLNRCHLGPNRWVLAPLPRRCYFKDSVRIQRPEYELLQYQERPKLPTACAHLADLDALVKTLEAVASNQENSIGVKVDPCLQEKFRYAGRSGMSCPSQKIQNHYANTEFLKTPSSPIVHLVKDTVQDDSTGTSVANEFRDELLKSANHAGIAPPQITISTAHALLARLDEITSKDDGDTDTRGSLVVVLLLGTFRNRVMSGEMQKIATSLDKLNMPWRRAYYDDPRVYSVRAQFPSIMSAVGATPHAVIRTTGETLPWSIGIDLSHPKAGRSIVCTALIQPDGMLHTAWTSPHPRDETVEPTVLKNLLAPAMQTIQREDPGAGVLIIRDGRLFEQENSSFYRSSAFGKCTLIEVRKRNNPIIYTPKPTPSQCPHPHTGALSKTLGREVHLVTIQSGRNRMETPLKVMWRSEWDGLGLGAQLPELVYGLTLTPGLAADHQKRNVPAPIYWADGIAASSDLDLRFRGQRVIRLK